mgnify:FL=1
MPIVDGRTLGCWWGPNAHGARPRTLPIRGVVWHWTGGEGSAEKVAAVLRERGLSIHYVIDADGRTVQMADPSDTVCYHAGSRANAQFVGVEIVNRGVAPSLPKRNRAEVDATVRGRKVHALAFADAQLASVAALADQLSSTYGIPKLTPNGTDTFKPADLAKFRGHLEHLHVSDRKVDCCGQIIAHLRRHWGANGS